MANKFPTDEYIWIPDDEEFMVPAQVVAAFDRGSPGQVRRVTKGKGGKNPKPIRLSAEESQSCIRMDKESLESIDDMVQLKNLDEASIHYNLKLRYESDAIYTWVSKILISINPFKMLSIYDPQVMDDYLSKGARNLPPHIYGVADDAFRAMQSNKLEEADQACIVSGESGAGKTEATKLFLQYIAEKSRREMDVKGLGIGEGSSDESLQQKVLEANPLMEAFGNAKTVRNDNSSRFGKFINVEFSGGGAILGGSVQNYLLEKSRLVTQGEGERNYHIFYQLCAAAQVDPALKAKYHLSDASQYYFLNQSKRSAIDVEGIDDADEWLATLRSMEVISLNEQEKDQILSLLCGILHLGNIEFDGGKSDSSVVKNQEMLSLAAEQLEVDADTLKQAITTALRRVPGQSPIYSPLSKVQAVDARDALAKAIYSVLFDYLIERINDSLKSAPSKVEVRNMGVLDIFGFEDFVKNSFEQLCINYTNERLQGHFNDHIFKLEKAEYKREGVALDDNFEFQDNSSVIKVIDQGKGKGILSVIDEAIKSGREVADKSILEKILAMSSTSNGVISEPKITNKKKDGHLKNCFVFTHYAGQVAYDVDGFVEKNRDLLQRGLYEAGEQSKNKLLSDLFKGRLDPEAKKKSLGIQFRDQLNDLMDRISQTQPSFVRCIKPNSEKVPDRFTSNMVLDQLRYAGVLEVCRIRKLGYPVRKDFKQFLLSYQILVDGGASDAKSLCTALEKSGLLAAGDYAIGTNKVFMRDHQFEIIEEARESKLTKSVVRVQAFVRMELARMRYLSWQDILSNIQMALKSGDAEKLESALMSVGTLPFRGRHIKLVQDAHGELAVLLELKRVENLLTAAIESEDLAEIQVALKAASECNFKDKALLSRAHDTEELIMAQRKIRAQLRAAVDAGTDKKALRDAIKLAEAQNLKNAVETRDAVALLERLEKEEKLRADLEDALKKKKEGDVRKCMNSLVSLGVSGDDELIGRAEEFVKEQAQLSLDRENEQTRLLRELEEAIDKRDLTALMDLEVAVLKIGLEEHELVRHAMELRERLESARDVTSALAAEVRAVQHKAQSEAGVSKADISGLEKTLQAALDTGLERDESAAIRDAEALLERIDKQAEVQAKLVEICKDVEAASGKDKLNVKRANKDSLVQLLAECQELGIASKEAKKVRYWVGDIEQAESHENAAALASSRQERLEKLRDASKDDIEEQAMLRLQSLTSEEHAARIEAARDDAVFDIKNYYRLRSDEDFTQSLPADDRILAAKHKLMARSRPIPKSLLALSDEQNRTALRVNRAILQYCGEMSTSFPATLAQYILVKGLEDPEMCDEIYMQLCKHVHANPKPESADRAWLLMCMATKTFPPTDHFTNFLLNFLIRHRSLAGLQGNYASLCIVQLDATIGLGPSFFKPNLEEIQSYRKRPPVLATIRMLKGDLVQYPVSPDLRIAQVLELIRRQHQIDDDPEVPSFGIFVKDAKEKGKLNPRQRLTRFYKHYNPEKLRHVDLFLEYWAGKEDELFAKLMEKYGPEPDDEEVTKKGFLSASVTGAMHAAKMLGLTTSHKPPPAPVSAWPLPWWSHMGDVFLRMTAQGKEPLFEFKRRLFLDGIDETEETFFWQLLGDIRAGDLVFNEEAQAAEAALLALALQSDKYKPPAPEHLAAAGLTENLSPDWRRKKRPEDWARVAVSLGVKLSRNPAKLRQYFVNVCKKSPVYGMTLFAGRQADTTNNITIGVDKNGISFVEDQPHGKVEVTKFFDYKDIVKYGASVEYCWLAYNSSAGKRLSNAAKRLSRRKNNSANVLIYTLQSWEMYEVIFDYTHAGRPQ
ncbi:Myosin-1 [Hondaea fermentalgiana]|uniref:Myosin-1 n=1 Tax=Hondaea fermentalgiana TaxID=2315210 RepID=A0A2R5GKE9_9STRA|nr:Myosin-1 [Hondaea fermentalgiana]|eukprot:GBG31386.1 Myosin-1 [Hondaea fermentalgiana]